MSKAEENAGIGKRNSGYISEVVAELRKVSWPSKAELQGVTWVILVITATVSIILGGLDSFLSFLADKLFLH